MSSLHAIDAAFAPVLGAVESGAIPGAALGIVTADGDRAVRHIGLAQREPETVALTRKTWFDLASLTKVIFTTTQVLEESVRGNIDLDAPLTSLVPDYRQYHSDCWERQVTFRQCLGHATPFPAVAPLYTYERDPETLRAFILQRQWDRGPPVYSDINFILLGIALERLRGQTVSEMDPGWGMSFRPVAEQCAATERCTWRGRVMRGEVHDENAYALGGAGHAGLFGTIDAVLDFARDVLAGNGLSAETVRLMRAPIRDTRSHGWELPHPRWSGGDQCNDTVTGHTGFTGTGLWIDFERGQAWSLLTNRVHPSRHTQTGIVALRRAVGDAINLAG